MGNNIQESAKANALFAKSVTLRASEIAGVDEEHRTTVIEALLKARDEFLKEEPKGRKKLRTYHWANLVNDVKWYVINREEVAPDSFSPITDWEQTVDSRTVANTLKEAGQAIAKMVEERTITAGRLGTMDEMERNEYILVQEIAEFLRGQGLHVEMSREWEDPNAPIDYRGTVDGVPWAFELTQMKGPPKNYYRKIGHPIEKKSLEEQVMELEEPLPQIPDGLQALQRNLNRAVQHGRKGSKIRELDGARYCLVIHNEQFLHIPDWERITWPDLSDFDAIVILHDQMVPPARVWQVIPQNAFGRTVSSGTIHDLEMVALAQQANSPDPEIIRGVWRRLDELGITDEDFLEAIKEVKGTG